YRRLLRQQESAAGAPGRLPGPGIEAPEALDLVLLTHDYVCRRAGLGEGRECRQGRFAPRFNQGRMADKRDPLKFSIRVAASMERAAIEWTLETVIAYVTGHHNGMQRTPGKKGQDFGFLSRA